jgi:hypothetical protein
MVTLSELGFEPPRRAPKAPVQNARTSGHKKDEQGDKPNHSLQESNMKVVSDQVSETTTLNPAMAPEPASQATQAPPAVQNPFAELFGILTPVLSELNTYTKTLRRQTDAMEQIAAEASHAVNLDVRQAEAAERAAAAAQQQAEYAERAAHSAENLAAIVAVATTPEEEKILPTKAQLIKGAKKAGFWTLVLGSAGALAALAHAGINKRGIFAAKKAPTPAPAPVLPTLP